MMFSALFNQSPRFGDKYLVYSSYPNGYPVLEMTEKTAEKVLKKVNPSLSIDRNQYVYGRTQWHSQTVGSLIFPLREDDSRTIDGILDNPGIDQTEKDVRINQLMPELFSKDTGETHVYDLSINEVIQHPDKALLLGEAAAPNEAATVAQAVLVAPLLPGALLPTPLVKAVIPVALPPRAVRVLAPVMPAQPVKVPAATLPYPVIAQPETPPPQPVAVITKKTDDTGSVWQWPPPKAPEFWALARPAPVFTGIA